MSEASLITVQWESVSRLSPGEAMAMVMALAARRWRRRGEGRGNGGGGVGEPSSGASLASCSPYGRNNTKADIYISANDFGIYPSAQGKYPKKITKPIVLETVVLGDCRNLFFRFKTNLGRLKCVLNRS